MNGDRPSGFSLDPPLSSVTGATGSTTLSRVSFGPQVRLRRALPLVPLAPTVVAVVGIAVAIAIGFAGLDRMAHAQDAHVATRAEVLASALAERLATLTPVGRREALQLAARRTGAELLLVEDDGAVVGSASPSIAALPQPTIRDALVRHRGVTRTSLGRARYATADVAGAAEHVITFVRAPTVPEGRGALLTALAALTMLLVGIAATFGYAVARDANGDVVFLEQRVRAMARVRIEPAGEMVPVRAMDEVGVLTSAFDELVARFVEAERGYRANLARARGADRDRAAFLAAVSHELRSPLNAILGFADILATEVDGPLDEGAREDVEQIRASGAHLLELINDILEFSALEGGQLKLQYVAFDLASLASEVVREASPLVDGRPLDLRVEGAGAPIPMEADARRVRQVLTNLVGNAVKFTQRGEVVVALAVNAALVRIAVKDTGPGISEAERAAIFEEYRQAQGEKTRRRGTGLGLAIARRLVLLHGGSIDVESELGRGSTFIVHLPMHRPRRARRSLPP